jgi:hypothetical protein
MKNMYEKVSNKIKVMKDVEKLLEMDRDERKFDKLIKLNRKRILVSELKILIKFKIKMDKYIKKVIKEEKKSLDEDEGVVMKYNFEQ